MANPERPTVYRQGFTSTEGLTELLNNFVETPQRKFLFFSGIEYEYPPLPPMPKDARDERKVEERQKFITTYSEKLTRLSLHSRDLARKAIHVALPAGGREERGNLRLQFTPLNLATYWSIVGTIYNEAAQPPPEEMVKMVTRDLSVVIPADRLSPPDDIEMAKYALAGALKSPGQNGLTVESIGGLTKFEPYIPRTEHSDMIQDEE